MTKFQTREILKGITEFEVDASSDSIFLVKNKQLWRYSISEKREMSLFTDDSIYAVLLLKTVVLCTNNDATKTYCIDRKTHKYYTCDYVLHFGGYTVGNRFYVYADYKSKDGYIEIDLMNLNVMNFWELPPGTNGITCMHRDKIVNREFRVTIVLSFREDYFVNLTETIGYTFYLTCMIR